MNGPGLPFWPVCLLRCGCGAVAVREASHHATIPHSMQLQVVMVLSVNRGKNANVHSDWLMHECFSLYCNHLGGAASP